MINRDKLKVWGITLHGGGQMRVIVAADNKKAALAAINKAGFNCTMHHFNGYGAETGNEIELGVAKNQPGVVFARENNAWDAPYLPQVKTTGNSDEIERSDLEDVFDAAVERRTMAEQRGTTNNYCSGIADALGWVLGQTERPEF